MATVSGLGRREKDNLRLAAERTARSQVSDHHIGLARLPVAPDDAAHQVASPSGDDQDVAPLTVAQISRTDSCP